MTSNDLSRGRQCNFLLELSTTVLYDMILLKYSSLPAPIAQSGERWFAELAGSESPV